MSSLCDKREGSSFEQSVQLFEKKLPNFLRALFPFKWIWYWFTRRFNIFVHQFPSENQMSCLLLDKIMYGEAPRFSKSTNSIFFSDMLASQVIQYDLSKQISKSIVEIQDDYVSGLGFLPNEKQLLLVSMKKHKILVHDLDKKTTKDYADVSSLTKFRTNDLVVDVTGRMYVGNFGFDFTSLMDTTTTTIVQIDTDRSIRLASKGLFFPNGSVITPDGKTLILAETFAGHLTAFDIDPTNGTLSNRRVWADVGVPLDGICLDVQGFVWAAVPQVGIYETCGGLIRVEEGGRIHDIIGFGRNGIKNGVFACILGTNQVNNKHYLYFLEAKTADEKKILKKGPEFAKQNGFLKAIEVQNGPALHPTHKHYCAGYC